MTYAKGKIWREGILSSGFFDLGLCPSSGILNNAKEQNVSEIETVSFIRCRVRDTTISNSPKRSVSPVPSPKDGNRSSFRNVEFFIVL
jgi:hypothetical protein